MKKRTRSFRVNALTLDKAAEMGLDVNKIVENSLEKAIKSVKCPTCGQKLKSSKAK